MLSNVFFDLDGTLTDPQKGITRCIRYALDKLDRPLSHESDLTRFIGPPLRLTFAKLLASDDEDLIEKAVGYYRERFSETGLFENHIYPGISGLLAFLHRKSFKLYVVTSKPEIFAKRIVRHFSLNQYFRAVFGPSLDGRFDNKGELIGFILQELSLMPEETMMIGDRREDIVAGKLNATRTIGVTCGYGREEEITTAAPDFVCRHPSDIRQVIMKCSGD
jgi:phosphoglycolate phosphatase